VITLRFRGFTIGKRPIIQVFFEIPALKISKMINFLVDTGSIFSAITEKEAMLMGIDCSMLPDSKVETIGFGGFFKTKIINKPVILTFRSEKGEEYKIRYSSGFIVILAPSNLSSEDRERFLGLTPNVLGMDVLTKFKIHIDKHTTVLELAQKKRKRKV